MKTQTKPRIPRGFYLEDYDSDGHHKHGIFFYGSEVLFGWEKDEGRRSYKFQIALTNTSSVDKLINPDKKEITETINFTFTCDLKDYTLEYEGYDYDDYSKKVMRKDVDLEKILLEAAPEQYRMAIQRVRRRIKGFVPEPVPFTGEHSNYFKDMEFIEFTKDSAASWAGPHTLDKKKGALAKIKEKETPTYPILDVRTQWRYWGCLNNSLWKMLDELAVSQGVVNGDHLTYHWTPEQKAEWFDQRTVAEKHSMALGYYSKQASYINELLPFSLYICGNDDCSYTKWFSTREDAETELKRLRMMQPCDMNQDIYKQGYEFTN